MNLNLKLKNYLKKYKKYKENIMNNPKESSMKNNTKKIKSK